MFRIHVPSHTTHVESSSNVYHRSESEKYFEIVKGFNYSWPQHVSASKAVEKEKMSVSSKQIYGDIEIRSRGFAAEITHAASLSLFNLVYTKNWILKLLFIDLCLCTGT